MKKVCSIVSLCVCSLVSPALALCQSVPDTLSLNGLRVTDVTFKGTVEDSLLMNMRLSTSGMDIGGMDRVTIIPMLTDDFGNAYEFNPLVVDGKKRSRVAYREALLGQSDVPQFCGFRQSGVFRRVFVQRAASAGLVDEKLPSCLEERLRLLR